MSRDFLRCPPETINSAATRLARPDLPRSGILHRLSPHRRVSHARQGSGRDERAGVYSACRAGDAAQAAASGRADQHRDGKALGRVGHGLVKSAVVRAPSRPSPCASGPPGDRPLSTGPGPGRSSSCRVSAAARRTRARRRSERSCRRQTRLPHSTERSDARAPRCRLEPLGLEPLGPARWARQRPTDRGWSSWRGPRPPGRRRSSAANCWWRNSGSTRGSRRRVRVGAAVGEGGVVIRVQGGRRRRRQVVIVEVERRVEVGVVARAVASGTRVVPAVPALAGFAKAGLAAPEQDRGDQYCGRAKG